MNIINTKNNTAEDIFISELSVQYTKQIKLITKVIL